jgi:hypothetical protein
MGEVQRIDRADNSTGDPRMLKQQFETGANRVYPGAQADVTAGQGFFTRIALPCSLA